MVGESMETITLQYYDKNATQFCEETQDVDMSACHHYFEKYLPGTGKILDLGCGSGRDSRMACLRCWRP